MRRNQETLPLKKALDAFLDYYKLKPKLEENYIQAHWEKIMGSSIASRTEGIYVKNNVLFLKISSAPLRNELLLGKSKLVELLNKEIGSSLIKEVIFI